MAGLGLPAPAFRARERRKMSAMTAAFPNCGHRAPPSARMCKRCSLFLPRDRAAVSLLQWRKRRHFYRGAAACAVVLLQLVKAKLLGGVTCVINLGRSP